MIDISFIIAGFTSYYRDHVKSKNGYHEVCTTDLDHMCDFLFDIIRCAIANIREYGEVADTYTARHPALISVESTYFNIIGANIWDVTIRRYSDNGRSVPVPYGIRIELGLEVEHKSNHGEIIKFRIQAGSDTDDEVKAEVQKMLEKVVWRLDNELSDEEKVILMMSKLGYIKEFLLPA